MDKQTLFKGKRDDEKTSMQVTFGFLRFIENFRGKRESYEQYINRLILSNDVSVEEKQIIKEAKHDYLKSL